MPVKEGTRTTADYLDFDKVLNAGRKLMKEDKKRTFGFFLIVAINTGLRVSDVLTLTYEQLRENEISLFEKKTGKYRLIPVNDNIRIAFNQIDSQN
jgi:integrase